MSTSNTHKKPVAPASSLSLSSSSFSSSDAKKDASPEAVPLAEVSNWQLLRRAAVFLLPVRYLAGLAGLLTVTAMVIDVTFTYTNMLIIDKIAKEWKAQTIQPDDTFWGQLSREPLHSIFLLALVLGGLVLLSSLNRFLREYMNMKLTMDMVYYMREAVYDRLQRVGFSFHDEKSSGQLINRALGDLQNVRGFLNNSLIQIIEIFCYVIGYTAMIMFIHPWAAVVAFIPLPFWILYIRSFAKKMQPAQRAQMEAGDNLTTVFTENIAGVHVVKAFATEPTEIKKYNAAVEVVYGKVMKVVGLWRNFTPTVRGIASASHLALFTVGSVLIIQGKVEVGVLLAFGTAMGAILGRLQQINNISDQYQKAVVSARRFYEIIDAPPSVPELPEAPDLPRDKGGSGGASVEFNFVSFGYSRGKPVVHDIAFDCPAGAVVAVVGPTGSGKSTLMQLLARYYDPDRGSILINNMDIRKVNLRSIRRAVGFVFQETFLFSATVAENIRYGKPDATAGEIEAAARIAQAHEFIMEFPQGYDTMLGERGASLSGGQRQRLAIARAIISDPRILILDDALAAVDPETEHLISRALELVMVDRTVFIIAHRLSTVKAADLVIVLEDGRITQAGTHKELIRQQGHYRHIAEVQLAYAEVEANAKAVKAADKAAAKV